MERNDYWRTPRIHLFVRAGGGCTTPKSKSSPVNKSLSDIAKCLTNVLSSPRSSAGTNPAKSIDSRSKCYKQLGDLNSLKIAGVLSEEEYCAEKAAVMSTLKKV